MVIRLNGVFMFSYGNIQVFTKAVLVVPGAYIFVEKSAEYSVISVAQTQISLGPWLTRTNACVTASHLMQKPTLDGWNSLWLELIFYDPSRFEPFKSSIL